MTYDKFGNVIYDEKDLIDLIYRDQLDCISQINLSDTPEIQKFKKTTEININIFDQSIFENIDQSTFDHLHQDNWFLPEEYESFDIEHYCLNLCSNDCETQRVKDEYSEFQRRKMVPLLRWLKYLVDTCRRNNIVWGVGRGSSVSSFVLFLIGVHKIDPIKYGLDWKDFLR
jgi:DNA polymerase III alpha subunit